MRLNRVCLCDAFIVFGTVANALLLLIRCWSTFYSEGFTKEQKYTYVGDDYPEHLPLPIPPTMSKRVFDLASTSFPISGPTAAEQWESIYPPGYGFVRMGDQSRLLCIALFHQLHCIEKMRIYFDDPHGAGQWVSWPHQHHCMNYLRQSVLCRADRTLESFPPDVEDELRRQLIEKEDGFKDFAKAFIQDIEMKSGELIERQCSDSKVLFDFAGKNYVEWKRSWNITSPWDELKAAHEHGHGRGHGLKHV